MNTDNNKHVSTSSTLDDERRVKVLSPGMLVAKRFFRNRLAVIGLIIIATMFIFTFIGGAIAPYGETQVFRYNDIVEKDYAGVGVNNEFQYIDIEGETLPPHAKAQMILTINKGEDSFISNNVTYSLIKEGEDFYRIVQYQDVATVINLRGMNRFNSLGSEEVTDAMIIAFEEASNKGETSFDVDGITYYINQDGKETVIARAKEISLASKLIYNNYAPDTVLDYEFRYAAEKAMNEDLSTFQVNGTSYEMDYDKENNSAVFYLVDGNEKLEYSLASNISINTIDNEFLTIDFKKAAIDAIQNEKSNFIMINEEGEEANYILIRENDRYKIRTNTVTQLINTYESPSETHPLGTDGNGMDLLTRLMYGGRISLIIGFVVVVIELVIGVLLGGIAGYFGGTIDSIIMRFVDIINCIPSMPLYIILGSVMDFMRIEPRVRIYWLMIILGILGWPYIARMVRGQILSLREQEFMVATESMGISVRRRIFRHLIPNIIPQLTVIATMNLGSVILTEATLSFLGLGVKFPYASWGNIINAVNDVYVMTNYWFVWIPAGMLILITVLGFNFIGDGLRDAFDPKMKR